MIYPTVTEVGGYPLFYITADNGTLCPECAEENSELTFDESDKQWYVAAQEINYEDEDLYCDHCSKQIPSAYGEDGENILKQRLRDLDVLLGQIIKLREYLVEEIKNGQMEG